jgi:hypothetical protein
MTVPKVPPQQLVEALQSEFDAYAREVMEALNQAPDGAWIEGSEEQVRDLSADFRRRVFERAVQMRINAAEAAFSPSAEPDDRQARRE